MLRRKKWGLVSHSGPENINFENFLTGFTRKKKPLPLEEERRVFFTFRTTLCLLLKHGLISLFRSRGAVCRPCLWRVAPGAWRKISMAAVGDPRQNGGSAPSKGRKCS